MDAYRDFKFKSALRATLITKGFGLVLVWASIDVFLGGWASPSWEKLPYLLMVLPFGLAMAGAGAILAIRTSDIEILDGQLRFRRLFAWRSVPLESVIRVRKRARGGLIWATLEQGGKRYRLIINPEDFKAHLDTLPIYKFLEDVSSTNEQRARVGLRP